MVNQDRKGSRKKKIPDSRTKVNFEHIRLRIDELFVRGLNYYTGVTQ